MDLGRIDKPCGMEKRALKLLGLKPTQCFFQSIYQKIDTYRNQYC